MSRATTPLAALAVAGALVLSACGDDGIGGSDGGPTVVVSAYPFEFVADRVVGDRAEVESLAQPGVDAHDVELTPQQVGQTLDADVVVYLDGFQAAVDDAVAQEGGDDARLLDVADVVDLIESDGEIEHDHEGEDHAEGEEHDHDHEGEDHSHEGEDHADEAAFTTSATEDEHDHGGVDPHMWLDPERMVEVTEAFADRMAEVDPDGAETYRDNAADLVSDLTALDGDLEQGLATCERRTIVTAHEAFGYLADAYDLEQVGIAGLDPSNEPEPATLAEIVDLVRDDGITTIFTEELVSSSVADTVADEAGVEVTTLDPIEGLSDETADQTYLTLMERNLDALQEANGCS